MSIFKHSRKSLEKRGASTDDIENVNSQSHFMLLLVTGYAVVAATIIALLSRSLESLTFSYLIYVPWNVVLIGLGCVMILAIYIYWLGSRRNNNP